MNEPRVQIFNSRMLNFKKDYTKLYDSNLGIQGQCSAQGKSGKWHNARPLSYQSIFCNLRNAYNVLFGKADALYWTIDED